MLLELVDMCSFHNSWTVLKILKSCGFLFLPSDSDFDVAAMNESNASTRHLIFFCTFSCAVLLNLCYFLGFHDFNKVHELNARKGSSINHF